MVGDCSTVTMWSNRSSKYCELLYGLLNGMNDAKFLLHARFEKLQILWLFLILFIKRFTPFRWQWSVLRNLIADACECYCKIWYLLKETRFQCDAQVNWQFTVQWQLHFRILGKCDWRPRKSRKHNYLRWINTNRIYAFPKIGMVKT